ncbi:unnamed protein product [Lathyrus sativus]|nr:unnamed protein product [Lathyrus sativus]
MTINLETADSDVQNSSPSVRVLEPGNPAVTAKVFIMQQLIAKETCDCGTLRSIGKGVVVSISCFFFNPT